MRIEAQQIEKWYFRSRGESNRFFAVNRTDLSLEPGTVTVLSGRSGSGKTTLLSMMSGLLRPDGGTIYVDGQDLYSMNDDELSYFRNRSFGMIPQSSGVLYTLTVMENILIAHGIYGAGTGQAAGRGAAPEALKAESLRLMEAMGIEDLAGVFPQELSGGELRRLSAARALAGHPEVIFADEPTSDLDDENMDIVLRLLREEADRGAAVFIVTHDAEALEIADTALTMNAGTLVRQ